MTPGSRPRILLADDHALVCDALRTLLEPAFAVVGAVHRGDEVVAAVLSLNPDVLLLDVGMPSRNGIDVARQLRREVPALRIMLLTMHTDSQYVEEAWRIGVHGFALKTSDAAELQRGINEILLGRRYLSPPLASVDPVKRPGPHVLRLSVRQTEVLRLIAEGLTAPEIGRRLGIGPKTVDYHRIAVRRTLGLRTNADLVRYAVAAGLVQTPPGDAT
jgi:DNA-binding NarL/FixJ family response regulator